MKTQQKRIGRYAASMRAGLAVLGVLLLPCLGSAQTVMMSNGGSAATVDLSGGTGMNNWSVLGQNQLNEQWFWYSVNGGPAQEINQIGGLTYSLSSDHSTLFASYANSQIGVSVQYTLSGDGMGSGGADITESIAIDNLTGAAYNVNFYQYSYFNLLQSGNNTLTIFGDSTNGYSYAQQTSGSTAIAEGIIAPNATHAEAGNYASVLSDVQAGNTLNGNLGPVSGNVAWSFEWSSSIAGGGEYDISKDKSLSVSNVPEPSTLALIALGLGACGWVRRRHSS